ncbi:glycosyltransferase family 2 protein [Candidatus Saccharibacteria bacterium]|nr:MAG: glycosyltransferase family 2 protein [Candidatus Saccharibacteria bacterium]
MSKPLNVSVIIPAYNEALCLAACLDALAVQTIKPYEVIVVDNDSSDGTLAVAQNYPFATVIHETERGRVFARNAGFRAATGDVIARIDADAVVPPEWVAWVTAFYAKGNAAVALTGGAHFYNMQPSGLISWAYNWLIFRFNTFLTGQPTLWGSNMALSSSMWQKVAQDVCLDNLLHEDLDLAFHVRLAGGSIYYDASSRVRVEMRRVHTEREALWGYLQMWPRTLRRHGYRTWPICWFVGAALLYVASPLPVIYENTLRILRIKRRA